MTLRQYEDFEQMDYEQKVSFFDEHFLLIPFDFPLYDIEVAWYHNELKTSDLITFFTKETRNKNLYERVCRINDREFIFNIRPGSASQRYFLNKFILTRFFNSIAALNEQETVQLQQAGDPVKFLEARIDYLTTVVHWMKQTVQSSGKNSMRVRLLEIMHRGYLSFQFGNETFLKIRRKYVELYLYAQGLLLAQHLQDLHTQLEKLRKEKPADKSLSLPLKIVLLQQLGIIDLLKSKYEQRYINGYHHLLAELICLIVSESPRNRRSILKYVSMLQTGTFSDLINQNNIGIIRKKLEDVHLS